MTTAIRKTAVVTGGAGGMGRAIGSALAAQGDWHIHILNKDAQRGEEAAKELQGSFHEVDVTDYKSIATAFDAAFKADQRLDFVFANAGIVGKGEFYETHESNDGPPPPFPSTVLDVNLLSVINTSYLAQHYFRRTPRDNVGPRSLIITASTGGLYAAKLAPTYAAAKFGCVGWMRSIAPQLWAEDGIRVNAILPGVVRTNLLPHQTWNVFPLVFFTPMEKIQEVVMMLLDPKGEGPDQSDSEKKPYVGQAVEISCDKHYFREQHEFSDEISAMVYSQ